MSAVGLKGRRRILVVAALTLLAVAALFGAGAASAGKKSAFKLGLYVGRSSQGEPVRLKVVTCGENQCVEGLESQENLIRLPCPSINETSSEVFFPPINRIYKSGKVDADQEGFAKVVATLQVAHNGTMTGKIRATETLEDGTKCDSGKVTLKAKIGGSIK